MNDLDSYRSEQLMFIARAIATRGLAVMSVGFGQCSAPGCNCEPEPLPWSYTIGLVERRHPEVVTFGLPPPTAVAVLNWVHDRDVAGARIEPGVIERFEGVPIKLVPVPTEWVMSDDDPMGQWFHHYGIGRTNDRTAARPAAAVGRPLWCPSRRGRLRANDRTDAAAAPRTTAAVVGQPTCASTSSVID